VSFGDQQNLGRGPFGADFPSIDAFAPAHPFTREDAYRFLSLGGPSLSVLNSDLRNRSVGVYLQDHIEWNSKLKTLAGLRVDRYSQRFENKNTGGISRQIDTAASPRVGLVYQPSAAVSFYASYSRSFSPVFPTLRSETNQSFEPERSVQYEAGIKLNSFNDRLLTTISAYRIVKRNVLTADPDSPQFSIQTGRQRSKGIELDITGTPMRGWNVLAAYAFTQPQITADNTFPVGNLLENAARHLGNIWTTYEFDRDQIKGLGVGAGILATSKRNGNLFNSFVLPGYARVDASVFYTFSRSDKLSYKLSFNIKNLLDKTYYETGIFGFFVNPGAPRSALLSLTITRR
jgi:iron complex outermembrane receptor protein